MFKTHILLHLKNAGFVNVRETFHSIIFENVISECFLNVQYVKFLM